MNKMELGSGSADQRCISSTLVETSQLKGVRKLFKSMTGSSRRRLLQLQAAKEGKTPDDLLAERKDRKQQWQMQRPHLRSHRCPNCGHIGHNYYWCPFALPVCLKQKDRFRGSCGRWEENEPPLQLTQNERENMGKHFAILSMRLGSK